MGHDQYSNKFIYEKPISDWIKGTKQNKIHLNIWGNDEKQQNGIVMIHGGLANSAWYFPVAPHLKNTHLTIALDAPGHGQSTWLDQYNDRQMVEIIETIKDKFKLKNMVIIAHSFYGSVIARCLLEHSLKINKVIFLDPYPMMLKHNPAVLKARAPRYIKNKNELIERFRIMPPQPLTNKAIVTCVATHSITKTTQGYRWQFDPNFFKNYLPPQPLSMKQTAKLPALLIHGGKTIVTSDKIIETYKTHFQNLNIATIPTAHHAIMLDEPDILTQMILNFLHDR